MSTPSFGQSPVFGAAAPAASKAPPEEQPPARSTRTVVIAVAAGVVALSVLGGAAALVLGSFETGSSDVALPPSAVSTVEPSAAPSAPPEPLPTSAVQGRNVFVPLVEADAAASGDAVVDPVAAAATPSAVPTAAPTAAPVTASLLLPAVTRTVSVPGPVVTETVPGPTVTSSTPGPTRTVDRFAYDVEVASVEDPGTADSTATFVVNGTEHVVDKDGEFLELFVYNGYTLPDPSDPDDTTGTVMFTFGSSMWTVPVGTQIGLGPR